MSDFRRAPVVGGRAPPRKNPLMSLKMASMMDMKPVLPAEIIALIVEYLTPPDLIRFALVSKRMQEMVYDDARWVQRLRRMGCWDEVKARQTIDVSGLHPEDLPMRTRPRKSTNPSRIVNGIVRPGQSPRMVNTPHPVKDGVTRESIKGPSIHNGPSDGFDPASASTLDEGKGQPARKEDLNLSVLRHVRSVRGQARQAYGKVYHALAPFYYDAISAEKPMNCMVFRCYTVPDRQAQMLAQLHKFAKSDIAMGAGSRSERLAEVISIFDTAAVLEFRKGYEERDIDGRMRQYAHVLHTLNEGQTSIGLFINHNRLITDKEKLGTPGDCIDYASGHGQISIEQIQRFFDRLHIAYAEQHAIIERVFPSTDLVVPRLVELIGEKVLSPYLTSLFGEAHSRESSSYLKVVSGTFAQTQNSFLDVRHPDGQSEEYRALITRVAAQVYERHLDLYFAEELDLFKRTARAEIEKWDRALSEQATSTETFLMSNINRQAAKTDFLSSFKKVVMMPVNILPSLPTLSSNKSTAKALVNGDDRDEGRQTRSTDDVDRAPANPLQTTAPLPLEAPTTELAAKAAIMASKLETIRSLFSIEVALSLVHTAKAGLERVAQFNKIEGPIGQASKQQCSSIYVSLLHILGTLHVKAGFDKAVGHLSNYHRPRHTSVEPDKAAIATTGTTNPDKGVAPLTTFLELVNVGDLIQQMLDVFFESELIRLRVANRDDFLDPAVKEKKKFEQMLDERVGAGLGKGIDVLMDEVEYLFATTQSPHDFDPPPEPACPIDIGPTGTSSRIISLINTHTSQLHGTAEKSLLDVFSSEIGLRLFNALTKHIKRLRISTRGALPLLSDLAAYTAYIATFRNKGLDDCFTALREVGQLYLIEIVDTRTGNNNNNNNNNSSSSSKSSPNTVVATHSHNNRNRSSNKKVDDGAKEMAAIVADAERYRGIFTVEEVLEFAERRSDWLTVGPLVEDNISGKACVIM